MKLVTAIIQPYMFDKLSRALRKTHHNWFTMYPVKSSGVPEGEASIDLLSEKIRVDLLVNDDEAMAVTDLIVQTVGTHQSGDGLVFVSEITHAVNINTGQHGAEAILPD